MEGYATCLKSTHSLLYYSIFGNSNSSSPTPPNRHWHRHRHIDTGQEQQKQPIIFAYCFFFAEPSPISYPRSRSTYYSPCRSGWIFFFNARTLYTYIISCNCFFFRNFHPAQIKLFFFAFKACIYIADSQAFPPCTHHSILIWWLPDLPLPLPLSGLCEELEAMAGTGSSVLWNQCRWPWDGENQRIYNPNCGEGTGQTWVDCVKTTWSFL